MDACAAEPEIGEKKVAVRAAAEADETLAATRAFVHGVRHSVCTDALGRVGGNLDQAGTGMSSAVAALFARRRAVDRAAGVQLVGAVGVGAAANLVRRRGVTRSVTHGVLRWKGGFVFDKFQVSRVAAG